MQAIITDRPAYMIDSDGNVFSRMKRGNTQELTSVWKLLKQSKNQQGYRFVRLSGPLGVKTITVHKLVLEAFVGLCPDGMECRHLNGIRGDNRLCNLKWGTKLENHTDQVKHGTRVKGTNHPQCRFFNPERDIPEIRESRFNGETFDSIAKRYRVSRLTISRICDGTTWSHITQ